MSHHTHDRHPDCLEQLPIDSCHWDGCAQGVSALDRPCYHSLKVAKK